MNSNPHTQYNNAHPFRVGGGWWTLFRCLRISLRSVVVVGRPIVVGGGLLVGSSGGDCDTDLLNKVSNE